MKQSAKQIITRADKAFTVKSSWDSAYRDVAEYCTPARDGYQKTHGGGSVDPNYQDRRENLYSSVGEQSANEFVNTMQELMAPPMTPWIDIKAGFRVKETDKEAVNKELDKLNEIANEYKNNSTFDLAFSEMCYDVYIGTGCMLILPGTPIEPMTFLAIPIWEYALEEGANGAVIGVYRKYKMKREFMAQQWKELKGKKYTEDQKAKDVELIESTFFDADLVKWHYQLIDKVSGEELVHRVYKTNPFIVLRWNKCAGEPYGRGVGMTSINDIRTLNLIKYYSLRNLAYNTPPFVVKEDAMLDVEAFTFEPLSLNVVPDIDGIKPLQMSSNYDIESFKTQELEMQIKKDTFGSTLPNTGGRELTATEVRELKAEMGRRFNSVFGRLLLFQINLVKRIFDVLGDTGMFGEEHKKRFDVLEINGLINKVNIITPMGRMLKQGEGQAILTTAGTLVEFDPTGNVLNQAVKVPEMMNYYVELSGMPNRFINSVEEIKTTQSKQAQEQEEATNAAIEKDVQANNAKEMGKAEAKEAMSV